MKLFFGDNAWNSGFQFWGSRILLSLLVVLIYFIIWRPVRVGVTKKAVYPQVKYLQEEQSTYQARLRSGALLIDYEYNNKSKQLQYRPQFGLFFLISLVALFFVSQAGWHYLLLVGLHILASVLTYLCLMVGASGVELGFILTDAISGYLAPALSLALVPLVIKGFIE